VTRLGKFCPSGDSLLWAIFLIVEAAQIFGLLFPQMGLATFWATFLQNHLVTLAWHGFLLFLQQKICFAEADVVAPDSVDVDVQRDRRQRRLQTRRREKNGIVARLRFLECSRRTGFTVAVGKVGIQTEIEKKTCVQVDEKKRLIVQFMDHSRVSMRHSHHWQDSNP
jgi:hypothetical protein